jgi:hypothetical protein
MGWSPFLKRLILVVGAIIAPRPARFILSRETIYWLRLLQETYSTKDNSIGELIREADEISRIIGSIIVKTKKGKMK